MIKTFRGILVDGGQDRIRLSTKKGKVGYKIVKFQGFPNLPGTTDSESILRIYKFKHSGPSTTDANVDFTDGNLLAVLIVPGSSSYLYPGQTNLIVFDREIFNQDIYITHTNTEGAQKSNYYLELESFMLSDHDVVVATLKDVRQQN
jgi:hypothetical protein